MNKIILKDSTKHFAALKLIEQLYVNGNLPEHIYMSILNDAKKKVDISQLKFVTSYKEK